MKKSKSTRKVREIQRFISRHKLVAFDLENCTICGRCSHRNHPMQIGYANGIPASYKIYNELRYIMKIPHNTDKIHYYINVEELVENGLLHYKGVVELPPDCGDDEEE